MCSVRSRTKIDLHLIGIRRAKADAVAKAGPAGFSPSSESVASNSNLLLTVWECDKPRARKRALSTAEDTVKPKMSRTTQCESDSSSPLPISSGSTSANVKQQTAGSKGKAKQGIVAVSPMITNASNYGVQPSIPCPLLMGIVTRTATRYPAHVC
jgi:hypothetical protein